MKTRFPNSRFLLTIVSVLLLSVFTLFHQSDSASSKSGNAALVPAITVTKTGVLDTSAGGDSNGNGVVNPGDRINYTITVSNAGTDATNVIVKDVLNSNLTLVPGSINSSPIAVNENYSVLGNVRIDVPATSGVKVNDFDPDGTTPTITGFGNSLANANVTVTGNNGTSAQGGNV